jgi:hypothetical protein
LILKLCKSKHEIRVLLRHYQLADERAGEGEQTFEATDRRVTRNLRLSVIWAVLTVHRESPALLAAGLFACFGIAVLVALRVAGILR